MAVDPKLIYEAAKAAVKVVTDENARNKMLIVILAPLVAVLLILVIIGYIITSPISAIKMFFFDDDLKQAKDIRNKYGFNQEIDLKDKSYKESVGYSFSDVIFNDGKVKFFYYNEADIAWKDKTYAKLKLARAGCGPSCLARVVSSLTNTKINPAEMAEWATTNKYYKDSIGSLQELIPNGAKHYGLIVEGGATNEPQNITAALKAGKLIICLMEKGHFTDCNHFIVLRGISADGKILVADPISIKRSNEKFDLSTITEEVNDEREDISPFCIISNPAPKPTPIPTAKPTPEPWENKPPFPSISRII
jgi:hypothetical protein